MFPSFAALTATSPIIPILNAQSVNHALKAVEAIYAGGITSIEVVLRTALATDCITAINKEFPKIIIGAGTLTSSEQITDSLNAGAHFLVSPGTSINLLKAMINSKLPILVGVLTPSEIITAMEFGIREMKFFPATQAGGVEILKAYSAVFPEVKFFPTGGITVENMNDYLALPNVFAIGGTWIAQPELIKNEQWTKIKQQSAQAIKTIKK